jgi:hypothetical protein
MFYACCRTLKPKIQNPFMPSQNTVIIKGSSIKDIRYVDNSLVTTPGQDQTPPASIQPNGREWRITIKVDRKNSTDVADQFNRRTGGQFNEFAPDGGDKGIPNELNFYFAVDIEFAVNNDTATSRIYLGQGHYSETNNWWIGGNTVLNLGRVPTLLVIEGGKVLQRLAISGGVSQFDLAPY